MTASALTSASAGAPSLAMQFERIRSRLSDPDFLVGNGLSNEVPFFIFPYDAAAEVEVRARTEQLVEASRAGDIPARIVRFDLWDVFCDICAKRNILEKIGSLEARRGSDRLLARMQKNVTAEAFVAAMAERYEAEFGGQQRGRDVLLVTGVGKVYPFVRAHNILENAQPVFVHVPMVLLYPGVYDGQQLHLFGSVSDGNYYRAFNLL